LHAPILKTTLVAESSPNAIPSPTCFVYIVNTGGIPLMMQYCITSHLQKTSINA